MRLSRTALLMTRARLASAKMCSQIIVTSWIGTPMMAESRDIHLDHLAHHLRIDFKASQPVVQADESNESIVFAACFISEMRSLPQVESAFPATELHYLFPCRSGAD